MYATHFHISTSVATFLMGLAAPVVFAQSETNTTTCGFNEVPGVVEGGFYHNASANESFSVHGSVYGSENWRLTLTLSEQRRDEYGIRSWGLSRDVPILNYLLSVPETYLNASAEEETTTYVCIYPIAGKNHTSDGGGEELRNRLGFSSYGCSGVLSDECLSALASMNPATPGARTCPLQSDEATEACGFGPNFRPGGASTFNDAGYCKSAQLPGVDFPENTRLFDLLTYYYRRPNRSADLDENYDLHLRQSFPVFLTINTWSGRSQSLDRIVTCLSPGDNIVQGSRQPEREVFSSLNESEDDGGEEGNGGSEDSNDDDSGAVGRRLSCLALLPIALALVYL